MITLIPDSSADSVDAWSDEVIHLAKVLKAANQDFLIASATMLPNWRYQLLAAGLYEMPRWNAFDVIQQVTAQDGLPVTMQQLAIPADYTPVYVGQEVYYYDGMHLVGTAHIHAAGFVTSYDAVGKNGLRSHYQFDDRGFCTWRQWFQDDKLVRQVWYTPSGAPVIEQDADGVITVDPAQQSRFAAAQYAAIDDLIAEVVQRAFADQQLTKPVVASTGDKQWLKLRPRLGKLTRLTWLLSSQSESAEQVQWLRQAVAPTDEIIAPSHVDQRKLQQIMADSRQTIKVPIHYVPTYTTHLDLGFSNESDLQVIAWQVSNVAVKLRNEILAKQLLQVLKHRDWGLFIAVRDENEKNWFEQQRALFVNQQLDMDTESDSYQLYATYMDQKAKHQLMSGTSDAIKPLRASDEWPTLVKAGHIMRDVQVETNVTLSEWVLRLQKLRLFVDTGAQPNLLLQAEAVSAGVPIVALVPSDMIISGGNGQIARNTQEVSAAITHYLGSLTNWNDSLVTSVDLIEKYAPENILKNWQEVFDYGKQTDSRDSDF